MAKKKIRLIELDDSAVKSKKVDAFLDEIKAEGVWDKLFSIADKHKAFFYFFNVGVDGNTIHYNGTSNLPIDNDEDVDTFIKMMAENLKKMKNYVEEIDEAIPHASG